MNSVCDLFESLSKSVKLHLKKNFGITNAEEFEGWLNAIPEDDLHNTGLSSRKISQYLRFRENGTFRSNRKRSFGYIISEKESSLNEKTKNQKISFIDLKFSSNGIDHSDKFTQVADQGNAPSCTGFASAKAVEHSVSFQHEISGGYIYNRSKKIDGNKTAGSYLSSNLKALYNYGICREEDHPYDIPTLLDEPSKLATKRAKKIQLLKHKDLKDPNIVQWIIQMLEHGHVVVVGALVYPSSWFNEITDSNGKIFEPYPGEEYTGGHAFVITGYFLDKNSPGGGYFILLNSWGKLWASDTKYCRAGFGILSFQYAANNILEAYSILEIEDKWSIRNHPVRNLPESGSFEIPLFAYKTVAAIYVFFLITISVGIGYLFLDQGTFHESFTFQKEATGQIINSNKLKKSAVNNNLSDLTNIVDSSEGNINNELSTKLQNNKELFLEDRKDTLNHIKNVLSNNYGHTIRSEPTYNSETKEDTVYKWRSKILEEIHELLLRNE